MSKLGGRTIIVTGGGKGLGAAYAVAAAAAGAKVAFADAAPSDETVRRIHGPGDEAFGPSVDVSDRAAVDALVATIAARPVIQRWATSSARCSPAARSAVIAKRASS